MEHTLINLSHSQRVVREKSIITLLHHRILGESATEIAEQYCSSPPKKDDIEVVQMIIDYWHKNCIFQNCNLMMYFYDECGKCVDDFTARITE